MKTRALMVVNGVLLVAAGGGWWLQSSEARVLDDELAAMKAKTSELAGVQAEGRRLAAQQANAGELEQLRADHEALGRMKAELASLNARAGERAKAARVELERLDENPATPPGAGPMLAAAEWKDAGRASPAAAVETLLWAARNGNREAVAQTLWLDPTSRKAALAMMAGLSAEAQSRYGTPEQLLAELVAKDLAIGGMQVMKTQVWEDKAAGVVNLRLKSPDGVFKETMLRATLRDGAWKLWMPEGAVENYAAAVKGGATTVTGPK